jgi:cation diffusion facilitator CzcD-associated flavoprotein CzcO
MDSLHTFSKRVESIAVIGAGSVVCEFELIVGASGIVLAKAAIAQGFKSIRIFERRANIGGNWFHLPARTS